MLDGLKRLPNALVQLQAHYHHCGEAASEKCLSAATFVRWHSAGINRPNDWNRVDSILLLGRGYSKAIEQQLSVARW